MLPFDAKEVNAVSEQIMLDDGCLCESIEDRMTELILEVAGTLAEKHGLTEKQTEELEDRIVWEFKLLPPQD